jgi:dTMP kinase
MSPRPRFLVVDGIDGCGKSTQAKRLCRALESEGRAPLHLREPGSTRAGERIRAVLLEPGVELSPAVELLLFVAARRAMLDELVRPALARGRDVVCERFHAATFAYQGTAGGLNEEAVLELLLRWANEPAPELVLVLELPPEEAARRLAARPEPDRFEARGLEFQRRVARGFERFVERVPNARAIDARGSEDEVAARILAEVRRAAP